MSNTPTRSEDFYHLRQSYDYALPEELIAQHPAEKRDHARLLVANADKSLSDRSFSDLPEYLRAGDVLVLNESRVIPARLFVENHQGRRMELLLLRQSQEQADVWECLVRPGKHAREGDCFRAGDCITCEVLSVLEDGNRLVRFEYDHATPFLALLDKLGEAPLPPYIKERCDDPSRYQTVYARVPGSAAAPTAGFHFTEELLEKLRAMGVEIHPVVLHIGLGTFRPVKEDNILDHQMHTEHYEVPSETADAVNLAKAQGRRVISVGTTSCRTLEAAFDPTSGLVRAGSADTDLFLYPGRPFSVIDALITNFHLPESTLLMLVCAFYGYDATMNAYRHAVEERYRFFSFGDACLFL